MHTRSVGVALVLLVAACGKDDGMGPMEKYRRKSIGVEALTSVHSIARGAQAYYDAEQVDPGSMAVASRQLPGPSVGPTPPLGTCCKQGGTCAPSREVWAAETWIAIRFELLDPHYYSYAYEVAADGKSFTASAYGDIDCDGEYSTFSITGKATGEDVLEVSLVTKQDPLE